MVHYLPCGTKNLQLLFPAVPWNEVESYYVQATEDINILLTTGEFFVERCQDIVRLHFLNSLGGIDPVNLKLTNDVHENNSKNFIKSQIGDFDKERHSISRYNVTANNLFTAVKILTEDKVKYYEELLDSPLAWVEKETNYLPIVILDSKFEILKQEDRFLYELTIQYMYSKSKKIIRG